MDFLELCDWGDGGLAAYPAAAGEGARAGVAGAVQSKKAKLRQREKLERALDKPVRLLGVSVTIYQPPTRPGSHTCACIHMSVGDALADLPCYWAAHRSQGQNEKEKEKKGEGRAGGFGS